MALRLALLKSASEGKGCCSLGLRRWAHAMARPAPLDASISYSASTPSPPLVLPEREDNNANSNIGFQFPYSPFAGGSMELMAVPKKKVSRHKRGIRNGPKALKPVPVIIRCKVCGRVKLPHFFCCSGIKEDRDGQS